jgi:hypothetical protein
MPVRKSAQSLKQLALDVAVGAILRIAISETVTASARRVLTSELQELIFLALPSSVLQELTQKLFHEFGQYLVTNTNKALSDQIDAVTQITMEFASTMAHARMKWLNMPKLHKAIRDALLPLLQRMTGLESLDLGFGIVGDAVRRRHVTQALHAGSASNLRHVVMLGDCDDAVLTALAASCPHLSVLDVSRSTAVSDEGVLSLCRCRSLRSVDVYQTSVTVVGYASLMLDKQNGIHDLGTCDILSDVLEYIAKVLKRSGEIISCKSISARNMTPHHLRTLVNMSPNIEAITMLSQVENDADEAIHILTSLEHLRYIRLHCLGFHTDGIVTVIMSAIGTNLISLHLEHVDEMDMRSLCIIAENCSALQKLVLFSCDFTENFGDNLERVEYRSKMLLSSLRCLECVSETAPNVIEFLLCAAPNLITLSFGSAAWLNDDTLAKVVFRGGLKSLEDITVTASYELTMVSVRLLLDSCPRLKTVRYLEEWRGIPIPDLIQLHEFISAENYDLKL